MPALPLAKKLPRPWRGPVSKTMLRPTTAATMGTGCRLFLANKTNVVGLPIISNQAHPINHYFEMAIMNAPTNRITITINQKICHPMED
jgi:hypothetical protein